MRDRSRVCGLRRASVWRVALTLLCAGAVVLLAGDAAVGKTKATGKAKTAAKAKATTKAVAARRKSKAKSSKRRRATAAEVAAYRGESSMPATDPSAPYGGGTAVSGGSGSVSVNYGRSITLNPSYNLANSFNAAPLTWTYPDLTNWYTSSTGGVTLTANTSNLAIYDTGGINPNTDLDTTSSSGSLVISGNPSLYGYGSGGADYSVWRNNPGSGTLSVELSGNGIPDYMLWANSTPNISGSITNIEDWIRQFTVAAGGNPAAAGNVPEPVSSILAVLALAGLLGRASRCRSRA